MSTQVSMSVPSIRWDVYRASGTRLDFVDVIVAPDEAEAARKAADKHHDWRNDGLSWDVVVVPSDAVRKVTVTFMPEAVLA